MIKKTDTTFEVRGTKPRIMADLTMIMRHLVESGNFTNEDIDECVRISRQTEEEAKAETLKAIKELFEGIRDFGSDDKPKKSGKAVVVSVDADTPAEDVAKQISEVVAKTVAEMMGRKKEE